MKYYFVKFMIDGVSKDYESSSVFCIDKSANHAEAFIEIKKRINESLENTHYILSYITHLKELK